MAKDHLAERSEKKKKEDIAQAAKSYERRAKQKREMEKRGGR